jgi:5-amino-6-(5-phosphoribosylamino)uracil reductase
MTKRPYVVLSCAMSADGYIDDATDRRLLLSNDADFDRVDGERANADAILVGASTIRRDNPRLLVRSEARRADRLRRGLPSSPAKVTLTRSGDLDPGRSFFAAGDDDVARLVYCPPQAAGTTQARLSGVRSLQVIAVEPLTLTSVLADLAGRGVGRLFAEGGTSVLTQLLTEGLADELHLVVAPFFVGGRGAPRFVGDGKFPFDATCRMTLAAATQIGDVALLRYLMKAGDTAA